MRRLPVLVLSALLAAGLGGAVEAQSVSRSVAENSMMAKGTPDDFDAISKVGAAWTDYFCAAGEFARARAKASTTDRVVVTRSIGPSRYQKGRKAVGFTVSSSKNCSKAAGGFMNSGGGVGECMSVGSAINYCSTSRLNRNLDN